MHKLIIAAIATILLSNNVFSMRCGTKLINEGDYVSALSNSCGELLFNNGSTITYRQLDGMLYTLHVNSAGLIDAISFGRE